MACCMQMANVYCSRCCLMELYSNFAKVQLQAVYDIIIILAKQVRDRQKAGHEERSRRARTL